MQVKGNQIKLRLIEFKAKMEQSHNLTEYFRRMEQAPSATDMCLSSRAHSSVSLIYKSNI